MVSQPRRPLWASPHSLGFHANMWKMSFVWSLFLKLLQSSIVQPSVHFSLKHILVAKVCIYDPYKHLQPCFVLKVSHLLCVPPCFLAYSLLSPPFLEDVLMCYSYVHVTVIARHLAALLHRLRLHSYQRSEPPRAPINNHSTAVSECASSYCSIQRARIPSALWSSLFWFKQCSGAVEHQWERC